MSASYDRKTRDVGIRGVLFNDKKVERKEVKRLNLSKFDDLTGLDDFDFSNGYLILSEAGAQNA